MERGIDLDATVLSCGAVLFILVMAYLSTALTYRPPVGYEMPRDAVPERHRLGCTLFLVFLFGMAVVGLAMSK